MGDVRGDRLEKLMQERGLSQSELARRVGVKQPSIGRLLSGHTRSTSVLVELARELGTTPQYLTGEDAVEQHATRSREKRQSPDVPVAASIEQVAAEHGLLPIRHLDLAFGMGATYIDNVVEEEMRLFPEAFIRSFTNAPADLIYFAEGAGDSMMPTIHSRDVVIIDASDRRVTMADQIWACTYSGMGMIKRLRPMPDGGVKILSDNSSVPPETAYDGELSLFGRIVGVARKI